jgi:hypothetical protein
MIRLDISSRTGTGYSGSRHIFNQLFWCVFRPVFTMEQLGCGDKSGWAIL